MRLEALVAALVGLTTTTKVVHGFATTILLFSTPTTTEWQHRARLGHAPPLWMGGYYNEPPPLEPTPENACNNNKKKTHMVFGMKCLEDTVVIGDDENMSVTVLRCAMSSKATEDDSSQEAQEEEEESTWQREVALASFLAKQSKSIFPTGGVVTVLEDGLYRTGLVSLALAAAHRDMVVKACCTNLQCMQRLQSAQWMFGTPSSMSRLEIGTCVFSGLAVCLFLVFAHFCLLSPACCCNLCLCGCVFL